MKLSRQSALLAASVVCIALSAPRAPAAVVELNAADPPARPPVFDDRGGSLLGPLEYTIETDKAVYAPGDTVFATHTITNTNASMDYTLGFHQWPGVDLWVLRDDLKVWSAYTGFAQVIWGHVLPAGGVLEFDYTWDLTDYDGNPVAPGEYEVRAVVYEVGQSVSTSIAVVPEPGMVASLLLSFCVLLRRRTRQLSVGSVPVPPHGHLPRTVTRLP